MSTLTKPRRRPLMMGLALRLHLRFLSVFAVVLAVLLAYDVMTAFGITSWTWWASSGAAHGSVLDVQLMALVCAAAFAWPQTFDNLVVHGVSRRTIAKEQTLTNLAMAAVAAVIDWLPWAFYVCSGESMRRAVESHAFPMLPNSFRFMCSISFVGNSKVAMGCLDPSIIAASESDLPAEYVATWMPFGLIVVLLACLSLMVGMTMIGQLMGNVLESAHAHRRMVVTLAVAVLLFVVWRVVVNTLLDVLQQRFGVDYYNLRGLARGVVQIESADGFTVVYSIVWIPLAIAAGVAAFVAWVSHALVRRHEVVATRTRF